MKLIKPITMTDGQLTASNVAETDHAAWDSGTIYADGDFVISTTTHKVYESLQGSNQNKDPTDSANSAYWLEYSATNRWKVFDAKLADQTSNSGTITYSITPTTTVSGVVFLNLSAPQVRVQVYDTTPTLVYDTTLDLVDDSDIIDWWTFFTTDLTSYQTEAVFLNLPALAGFQIDITIGDGTGTPACGEIVLGKMVTLGETIEGTEIGLRSFSTKEQDAFGSWTIVSRAKSDPVEFRFAMTANDARRVKRVLDDLRDSPAVYFAHEDIVADYGALTYGFFQDYRIPLVHNGKSIVSLEIEGLT